MAENETEDTGKRKPIRYKCKKCGNKVSLYVKTLSPPTCNNPERHRGQPQIMDVIE